MRFEEDINLAEIIWFVIEFKMVETAQQLEGEQGLLDTKLEQEWTSLAKSQATTKQFLDSSVSKVLDDG